MLTSLSSLKKKGNMLRMIGAAMVLGMMAAISGAKLT